MSAPKTRRSGAVPNPTPRFRDAALRSACTGFLWEFAKSVDTAPPTNQRGKKALDRRRIRLVNREAEKIVRAVRAAVREQVRQLPGRAQRGALQAAMNSVAPKVRKALGS